MQIYCKKDICVEDIVAVIRLCVEWSEGERIMSSLTISRCKELANRLQLMKQVLNTCEIGKCKII